MDKDEKALQAFWCMYNSAQENNYSVSTHFNGIYIYSGIAPSQYKIGELYFRTSTEITKGKFFWSKKIEKDVYEVHGYINNVNRNKSFYFSFYTPDKVEEIKNKIIEIINKADEDALNEMLCDNK